MGVGKAPLCNPTSNITSGTHGMGLRSLERGSHEMREERVYISLQSFTNLVKENFLMAQAAHINSHDVRFFEQSRRLAEKLADELKKETGHF
jgi:hypothetical protein